MSGGGREDNGEDDEQPHQTDPQMFEGKERDRMRWVKQRQQPRFDDVTFTCHRRYSSRGNRVSDLFAKRPRQGQGIAHGVRRLLIRRDFFSYTIGLAQITGDGDEEQGPAQATRHENLKRVTGLAMVRFVAQYGFQLIITQHLH
jgi:hypothetical protein